MPSRFAELQESRTDEAMQYAGILHRQVRPGPRPTVVEQLAERMVDLVLVVCGGFGAGHMRAPDW